MERPLSGSDCLFRVVAPGGVELRTVDPWSLEGEAVRSTPQAGEHVCDICILGSSQGQAPQGCFQTRA